MAGPSSTSCRCVCDLQKTKKSVKQSHIFHEQKNHLNFEVFFLSIVEFGGPEKVT